MSAALQAVSFRKPIVHQPRKPKKQAAATWFPWTEKEDKIVKAKFPMGGFAACRPQLPTRTPLAIQQRANKLKLRYIGPCPNGRARIVPPKNADELIRKAWPLMDGKKRGEVGAFAERLQVPRWWLTKRAIALGLTMPHKKEPRWTAAETELLKRVPLHDLEKSAEIFREHGFQRSPTAIKVRTVRLEISRRYRDSLSATSAAKIIGIDSKSLTREILLGDLKAVKRKTERLAQQGGDPWSIEAADMRSYILKHLERIDLRKVDKFSFVQIIAGEPLEAIAIPKGRRK